MRIVYHEHEGITRSIGGRAAGACEHPLELELLAPVGVGVSRLNGHFHSREMHTKDARVAWEFDGRLRHDVALHEAPLFSEREFCSLTAAVAAINGWNRFAAAFRAPVGNYRGSTPTQVRPV